MKTKPSVFGALIRLLVLAVAFLPSAITLLADGTPSRHWIVIEASNKSQRTLAAELGLAIEEIKDNSIAGTADDATVDRLKRRGFRILDQKSLEFILKAFPPRDSIYHDYGEAMAELSALAAADPQLVSLFSAGSSLEGRALTVLRLNSTAKNLEPSDKPGIVFMGLHHAREHLSAEIPIMLANHLVSAYKENEEMRRLLDSRDVYIIPMVNPDGAEYDIEGDRYHMWRKNRRDNGGSMGVDLNRNYGHHWGGQGSSGYPASDTYRGPAAFSEPETQAMKSFIEQRTNIKILLSFHTFSELILYPWGYTDEGIGNARDKAVFETMAQTMAQWNRYTPQQSSDLYISSGDTTDWAYGEKGIFAFTFELTPKSMSQGGFYPGAGIVQSTFDANLRPCLYLISLAADPYSVVEQ
ncbi:MAG: zinc carboxypeptidase [Elusimicrobia bacterium]|nr:zinc carboxypeptidase [Elusimicrobiota bacterium]